MSNLFKALKPEAHISKNGFDLSQKHVFSSKAGQAIPCLAIETVPDDYHEIDVASLVRTQSLNTAAFLRGKVRYDFFFVPYMQLWHMFNQFISRRDDKHSTVMKSAAYCPNVKLADILDLIYQDSTSTDIHGYSWRLNAIRLLDMLGYGNFSCILQMNATQFGYYKAMYADNYVNIFRLAAYQHIWYDFYRNKFYDVTDDSNADIVDVGNYLSYFNWDDISCSSVANSHISVSTDDEKARIRGLLGMRYVQWKKDLFTSAMPGQQFGVVSSVDVSLGSLSASLTGVGSVSVNGPIDGQGIATNPVGQGMYENLGVNPSGRNVVYADRKSYPSYHADLTDDQGNRWTHFHNMPLMNVKGTDIADKLTVSIGSGGTGSFDVLGLYKAQVLQNWKQATLRAGNMTDDNFRAHFGVTPRYEGDENVDFLGSFDAPIQINTVQATATTGETINGKVGDLAATGTCVASGHKLSYKARDFGVIMCIASYLPESEYNANMCDKANTLMEEFDFFTPEFENIGLEAVSLENYDLVGKPNARNIVMGYAPRYWMYKTALDKVHGEFSRQYISLPNVSVGEIRGSLIPWVAPRIESISKVVDSHVRRSLSSFYVNPNVFNFVLGITADGNQNTDYLIHNCYFDVKSIRPMSVLGLPQF